VKTFAVSNLIRAHRALFVAATALLGVAASEVAGRSSETRYWLLLAGAALLMLVGDMLSSVDARARVLSAASSRPIDEAHLDLFGQTRPRFVCALGTVGVILIVAGFAVPPSDAHKASPSILTCLARLGPALLPTTFSCSSAP
jgi:hypothetical protein